jgi:hypothetical protein
MKSNSLIAIMALLVFAAESHAAVTVEPIVLDPGTSYTTGEVFNFTTGGSLMGGIRVTAYFGAADPPLSWTLTGGENGKPGVTAAKGFPGFGYWSLTEENDTFDHDWFIVNNNFAGIAMTRLVIDGVPGKTVFDLNVDGAGVMRPGKGDIATMPPTGDATGTTGSATGHTFEATSFGGAPNVPLDVLITYHNKVQLGANPAFGDLWTTLDIQFINPQGLPDGTTFHFQADTDNVRDLAETGPVPEPSSLALFAGLMVFGGLRRAGISWRGRVRR